MDDVKIFCPIVNGLSALQLQKDLLALKKWLLRFDITKTVVMHLGNTNQKYTYYMEEQPLQVVSQYKHTHKDLGVIIDSNLKFHSQATAVTNKANRILGPIKKSFNLLNISILYKSLVRPHLEYANVACYIAEYANANMLMLFFLDSQAYAFITCHIIILEVFKHWVVVVQSKTQLVLQWLLLQVICH